MQGAATCQPAAKPAYFFSMPSVANTQAVGSNGTSGRHLLQSAGALCNQVAYYQQCGALQALKLRQLYTYVFATPSELEPSLLLQARHETAVRMAGPANTILQERHVGSSTLHAIAHSLHSQS